MTKPGLVREASHAAIANHVPRPASVGGVCQSESHLFVPGCFWFSTVLESDQDSAVSLCFF